jgi:hypothetical protein
MELAKIEIVSYGKDYVINSLDKEIDPDEFNIYCSDMELPLLVSVLENSDSDDFKILCEEHEYKMFEKFIDKKAALRIATAMPKGRVETVSGRIGN